MIASFFFIFVAAMFTKNWKVPPLSPSMNYVVFYVKTSKKKQKSACYSFCSCPIDQIIFK